MDRKKPINSKEKKTKRKEELAKKQSIDDSVKAAAAKVAPIEEFPSFLKYDRNGLNLTLEAGTGDTLSAPVKQYLQELLKVNMEVPYGPDKWPAEERLKRREMVSPDARFVVEHNVPALYVYEIQLEGPLQGKGLGKFLMQILELVGRKNDMKAVILTVQKRDTRALAFYTSKLRYKIATISPSRWDNTFVQILVGADMTYEILCKTFDADAKSILEDDKLPAGKR